MADQLNHLAAYLVKTYEEKEASLLTHEGMRVNPIVSELATWYEKVRNAMDYRDEEVVLRAAIERILKRRHFYGGNGKTIAYPLLRELTWARYFPDGSISEEVVEKTEEVINLFLQLRQRIAQQRVLKEGDLNTFMYHLLSSHLAYLLSPNPKRETLTNFMFHVVKKNIVLADEDEETRDIQVYLATRRAFAKDDHALLSYHLFVQYFGPLTTKSLNETVTNFIDGYRVIQQQLSYPLRYRVFGFIKRNTAPFFILEEIFKRHADNLAAFINNEEGFKSAVEEVCQEKYDTIRSKVNRAIIRSIIFVLFTKTFVALVIETTIENLLYGHISWFNIALNIIVPPILLAVASLFIHTPGPDNTKRIYQRITILLFDKNPHVAGTVTIRKKSRTKQSLLYSIFSVLWLGAFFASFGIVIYVLSLLNFNPVSQAIFIFYLTIVAFLIHRIYQTAHAYTIEQKQHLLTPIVDFFFMPIARVGRHLTEGVSQVNILLFILDFIIEAPFKGLFAFFEQWFMFLHSKREYLDG